MYLLKLKSIIIIFAALFVFSCKPEGPRTPEEAYSTLKNAYLSSDTEKIENLLSARSREKIKTVISIFSSMNDSQLKALSQKLNISPGRLKNLTLKDYLSMHISQTSKENDILKIITEQKLVGVDIKDSTAVARLENGMEISFVKEGHYWKFDMEELSSGNN